MGTSLFQGFLPFLRDITVLEEPELDLHILSQGSTCLTLKWLVGHDSEKHVAREEVADMSYRDRLGENTGSLGHFGFASHSP